MSNQKTAQKTVSEATKTLAEKLAESMKVVDHAITVPLDVFNRSLPEGITPELVAAVAAHQSQYTQGAVLAAGEAAVDYMRGNAQVNAVPFTIAFGAGNSMTGVVNREQVFMPPKGGDPITSHGVMSSLSFEMPGFNRDDFSTVRSHLKDMGRKLLAGG